MQVDSIQGQHSRRPPFEGGLHPLKWCQYHGGMIFCQPEAQCHIFEDFPVGVRIKYLFLVGPILKKRRIMPRVKCYPDCLRSFLEGRVCFQISENSFLFKMALGIDQNRCEAKWPPDDLNKN